MVASDDLVGIERAKRSEGVGHFRIEVAALTGAKAE